MGCLNGVGSGVQMKTVEFCIDDDAAAAPPFHTSTALKAGQHQRQQRQQPQPQVPQPAQIRPSCLSRRTSFRFVGKVSGKMAGKFKSLPKFPIVKLQKFPKCMSP